MRLGSVRFVNIEFSLRAAFIGVYISPCKTKIWMCLVPFFPLYFKTIPKGLDNE
jgi:hypothetical protein